LDIEWGFGCGSSTYFWKREFGVVIVNANRKASPHTIEPASAPCRYPTPVHDFRIVICNDIIDDDDFDTAMPDACKPGQAKGAR